MGRNTEEHAMQHPSTHRGKPWPVLAGVLCLLGLCAAQAVRAEEQETFTNASLQGTYAYANNVSGVASLGPITFDGHGRLIAKIKVNLPCDEEHIPGCARTIVDLGERDGEYAVGRVYNRCG